MNRHLASKMSTDLSFSLDTSPPRVTQNLALWMSMPWACRCHVKSWRISTKSKHKGIQHQIQIQLKLCLAKPVFGEFPAAPCYLRCPEGTWKKSFGDGTSVNPKIAGESGKRTFIPQIWCYKLQNPWKMDVHDVHLAENGRYRWYRPVPFTLDHRWSWCHHQITAAA
jgi:hypothetical protein